MGNTEEIDDAAGKLGEQVVPLVVVERLGDGTQHRLGVLTHLVRVRDLFAVPDVLQELTDVPPAALRITGDRRVQPIR